MTPDPYRASGGPGDPGNLNRYAYTRGDPVNRIDIRGLQDEGPGDDADETPQPDPGNSPGPQQPKKNPKKDDVPANLDKWLELDVDCRKGLTSAMGGGLTEKNIAARFQALGRAIDATSVLKSAASEYGLDWRALAAIGIRETGFQNKTGSGGTYGVFQIKIGANNVTAGQANTLSSAASIAAGILNFGVSRFAEQSDEYNVNPLAAGLAFYDGVSRGTIMNALVGGSPIADLDNASDRGSYISSVLNLMRCF
jgi:hypothetical protein